MHHDLNVDIFIIKLKGLILAKKSMNYQDDRRHVVDYAGNLEASEIHLSKTA